jgi:hypothetical protein
MCSPVDNISAAKGHRLTNTASNGCAFVLQKLVFGQQVKKLADFCGSHRFIILFTKTCPCTVTSSISVQSLFSHFVYLKFIVILKFNSHQLMHFFI